MYLRDYHESLIYVDGVKVDIKYKKYFLALPDIYQLSF